MGINRYKYIIYNKKVKKKKMGFDRIKYEITCAKVFQHTQLERDRKINELQKHEGKLKDLLMPDSINNMSVTGAANDALETLKYVKGANIVLRNINILKEQSLNIEQMYKTKQPLGELQPLIHTVVWSTKRLNLKIIEEFNTYIAMSFDPNVRQTAETAPDVDLELKKNFAALMANPIETQEYLEKFCERNNIDKMKLMSLFQGGAPVQMQNLESDIAGLSLDDPIQRDPMQPPISFRGSDQNAGLGQRVSELRRIGA